MRHLILIYISLFLLGVTSTTYGAENIPTAWADLHDTHGKITGRATFTEVTDGVRIALEVHNLAPGLHGIHVHAVGECKTPDFKSAGPHFNPFGKQHGAKNPLGRHAGDLPNLLVQPDGTAKVTVILPHVTLGPGEGSLFPDEGTSLVIHANPDDEKTDPAGNSGERIVCGVITR